MTDRDLFFTPERRDQARPDPRRSQQGGEGMTIVTNIALICDRLERSDREQLVQPSPLSRAQDWLREHCDDQALILIEGAGPYGHDFDIWSASFNRIGSAAEEFACFATSIDWNFPEHVVLIVEPEEGDTRVFRPAFTPSDIWRT